MELDEYMQLGLDHHALAVPSGSVAAVQVGAQQFELDVEASLGLWGLRLRAERPGCALIVVLDIAEALAGDAPMSTLAGRTLDALGCALAAGDRVFVGTRKPAAGDPDPFAAERDRVSITAVTDEHLIGSFEARVADHARLAPEAFGLLQSADLQGQGGRRPGDAVMRMTGTFRAYRARHASDALLARLRR